MTTERRSEIELLLSRITQGEWTWTDCLQPEPVDGEQDCGNVYVVLPKPATSTWTSASIRYLWFGDMEGNTGEDLANAEFVAAAPGIIRELLAATEGAAPEMGDAS